MPKHQNIMKDLECEHKKICTRPRELVIEFILEYDQSTDCFDLTISKIHKDNLSRYCSTQFQGSSLLPQIKSLIKNIHARTLADEDDDEDCGGLYNNKVRISIDRDPSHDDYRSISFTVYHSLQDIFGKNPQSALGKYLFQQHPALNRKPLSIDSSCDEKPRPELVSLRRLML